MTSRDAIVKDFIEIELPSPENFLLVKETLTRMGVASDRKKELYQSCHILHKKGKYYIVHFKQLFELDGKESTFNDEDRKRRNRIAMLLDGWGLLKVKNPEEIENDMLPMNQVCVISHAEKDEWTLVPKYNLG